MLKLNINYDMMNKIAQAKGEHKLKMDFKIVGRFCLPFTFGSIIGGSFLVNSGIMNTKDATLLIVGENLVIYLASLLMVPIIKKGLENILHQTVEDAGFETIYKLSTQLNYCNLNTTPELLLKSQVYHKNYKLAMQGIPGVIRERYIYVPTYNSNLREEDVISLKEEHRIGSREYVLTLDTPPKKKEYKLAYGV